MLGEPARLCWFVLPYNPAEECIDGRLRSPIFPLWCRRFFLLPHTQDGELLEAVPSRWILQIPSIKPGFGFELGKASFAYAAIKRADFVTESLKHHGQLDALAFLDKFGDGEMFNAASP